jgi:pilus assembly protein CpaB
MTRSKPAFLLVVALGCGTVAAFAATQIIKDQGGAPPVEMVEILVAAKDIGTNTKVTADRFVQEKWPRDRMPYGAIFDLKKVEGKFTNQRLYQGEPLLERKLNLTGDSISQIIPPGYKVFDLPVDSTNGGVGYIQPGHRVDIHGFFEKGGKLKESRSLLVMENVEVLMVDGIAVRDYEEGYQKRATTIQLLIQASQYEALNTATHLGKLTVSLRPASDRDDEVPLTDNGDEFLGWVKSAVSDDSPAAAYVAPMAAAIDVMQTFVPPTPAPQAKKKMVVIYPSGTETYAWEDEGELPVRENGGLGGTAEESGNSAFSAPAGPQSSASSQSLPGGMVWDGQQWSYRPSGFKPAYPTADDDKTNKPGFSGNANPTAPSGQPAS